MRARRADPVCAPFPSSLPDRSCGAKVAAATAAPGRSVPRREAPQPGSVHTQFQQGERAQRVPTRPGVGSLKPPSRGGAVAAALGGPIAGDTPPVHHPRRRATCRETGRAGGEAACPLYVGTVLSSLLSSCWARGDSHRSDAGKSSEG